MDARYVTNLPEGEACVGVTEFEGRVIIATTKGAYELKGDVLEPIRFATVDHIPLKGNFNIYGVDLDEAKKRAHGMAANLVRDCYKDITTREAQQRYREERDHQFRIMTRP